MRNTKENKVNTSNLKVGMLLTYDEICKAIGEDPIRNSECRQQTYNWKRYFDYTYKNGKYKITCIYKEPFDVELEDWCKGYFINSAKYYLMVLMDEAKDKPYIIKTRSQLYNEVGLEKKHYNDEDTFTMDDVIDATPNIYSNKFYYLNTVLKDLRKQHLITWDKCYMIRKSEDTPYVEEEWEIISKDGRTYYNDIDRSKIVGAETDVLTKMYNEGKINDIDLSEVSKEHLFNEYHQQVNELLKERYGWISCYKAYKIKPAVTDERVWYDNEYAFRKKMEEYQQNMSDYIVDKLEKKYKRKHNEHLAIDKTASLFVEAYSVVCQIIFNPEMTNEELQECINSVCKKG